MRVSVGRIHYRDTDGNPGSRYFTVAAGVGADALLMSRLDARLKRRLGYMLYLIEAIPHLGHPLVSVLPGVLPGRTETAPGPRG